jgi:hypothetical protein
MGHITFELYTKKMNLELCSGPAYHNAMHIQTAFDVP